VVGSFEGRTHLFCDLRVRRECREETLGFPWISVERAGWSFPDVHAITAVALTRRPPQRDMPILRYAAEVPGQLVLYSRELPSPIYGRNPVAKLLEQPYPPPNESSRDRAARLAFLGSKGLFGKAAAKAWAARTASISLATYAAAPPIAVDSEDQARKRRLAEKGEQLALEEQERKRRMAWMGGKNLLGAEGRAAYVAARAAGKA
jgi:hypothetical protein